jgi:sulfite reductase (NADPH) hemoprotein beta-component
LLGGDGRGQRLNRLYRVNLDGAGILATLDQLFGRYASARSEGEGFGDFAVRAGLIAPVVNPAEDFHA